MLLLLETNPKCIGLCYMVNISFSHYMVNICLQVKLKKKKKSREEEPSKIIIWAPDPIVLKVRSTLRVPKIVSFQLPLFPGAS